MRSWHHSSAVQVEQLCVKRGFTQPCSFGEQCGAAGGRAPQSRDAFSSSQAPHCVLFPVLVGFPCEAADRTMCCANQGSETSSLPACSVGTTEAHLGTAAARECSLQGLLSNSHQKGRLPQIRNKSLLHPLQLFMS